MDTYRNSPYSNKHRDLPKASSDGWLSILLYYILPFVMFNSILFFCVTTTPKCTLTLGDTNDYLSTEVTMTVDSWFPTKSVSLFMDSEEIQMEKKSGRTYKAVIHKNGVVEAEVANINGMSLTSFLHVDVLDDNPPSIESSSVEDGIVTITFSDSQSGVNMDTIYALDSNDRQLSPLSLDRTTGTATFEMDPDGIRIYAQDMAGHTVQGTFTSHKEGDEDVLEGGEVTEPEDNEVAAE